MKNTRCHRLLTLLTVYLGLATMYLRPVRAEDMASVRELVRKRFPEVRQLSTQELAAWLSDSKRSQPLLVDVRGVAEFAVSHLQNAQNLESVATVRNAVKSKDTPVVLYCAVGYRSSALAEALRKEGLTNVWNLEGSIFAWANEGRPLYRGTNRVEEVHPYSAKWGKLLDAKFHPTVK